MPNFKPQFQHALSLHKSGKLEQAAQIYQEILGSEPRHPEALHMLGLIALQTGNLEAAVHLLRKAISAKPDNALAHAQLGGALAKAGDVQAGIKSITKAIEIQPHHPPYHSQLGNALAQVRQFGDAVAAHGRAIALRPTFAEAHYNLGLTYENMGSAQEAMAAYRQAIKHHPDLAAAHLNLGNLYCASGDWREGESAYRAALHVQPENALAWSNLGNALCQQKRATESVEACQRAITLDPGLHLAHNNLGNALYQQGALEAALTAYKRAIEIKPGYAEAHCNLGAVFKDLEQPDTAIECCRLALRLDGSLVAAYFNLGNSLKLVGAGHEAIQAYRDALALNPGFMDASSNLVYYLNFHPGYDTHAIRKELDEWNARYAVSLKSEILRHENSRIPDRRLRVGYVSPDFYRQAETFFTLPLLANHDHEVFEIHAYSSVLREDELTVLLRSHVDYWHDVRELSDADLAKKIRSDGIDILVDLTMHMGRHRALTFARKPAPVQICWLAYPGSTGLDAMDYRISDNHMDPALADESLYSERTWRMPDCWVVYDPLTVVEPRTASQDGPITFGSLNNPVKINEEVLSLWAEVLHRCPGSNLLVQVFSESYRERILCHMGGRGISSNRIHFVGRLDRLGYLRAYDRIDIALDSFPYNGITTTCDALHMGCPVVSLAGGTAASRAGLSIMRTVGLAELAAETPEEFVKICRELANDIPRLEALRGSLRDRMRNSPLMDPALFSRNMESAFRQMWQEWCDASTT